MFSVAALTRQLKLTRLSSSSPPAIANAVSAVSTRSTNTNSIINPTLCLLSPSKSSIRSFATSYRKPSEDKSVKRQRIQARKKKKSTAKGKPDEKTDGLPSVDADSNEPFLQHQEWVKFQQSITVDGFQTGQTVTASSLKATSRGGKNVRKRREKELERLQQASQSSAVDLKYPAIRYSEEETQELLKLAFAARPPRAGKRGSRALKRQARRWKLVRKIRDKYKRNIVAAHDRKMEKRSWKRHQVKEMKTEIAPSAAIADQEYQKQVMTRWAETMFGSLNINDGDDVDRSDGKGIKTISAND